MTTEDSHGELLLKHRPTMPTDEAEHARVLDQKWGQTVTSG